MPLDRALGQEGHWAGEGAIATLLGDAMGGIWLVMGKWVWVPVKAGGAMVRLGCVLTWH